MAREIEAVAAASVKALLATVAEAGDSLASVGPLGMSILDQETAAKREFLASLGWDGNVEQLWVFLAWITAESAFAARAFGPSLPLAVSRVVGVAGMQARQMGPPPEGWSLWKEARNA